MELGPFDFVNAINSKEKTDLMADNEEAEKKYSPFLTNRAMSYFNDTIGHANRMNMLYHLDNKLQFHFYLNIVRPRVRRSKWHKKIENTDLEIIQQYYGYSSTKAKEALSVLSPDQINEIKIRINGWS
jgi:hypothetical protein